MIQNSLFYKEGVAQHIVIEKISMIVSSTTGLVLIVGIRLFGSGRDKINYLGSASKIVWADTSTRLCARGVL